jgi:hypothetical protein
MQTTRTVLLILGLLAFTLFGCASLPTQEDDTLAAYRQELAKLVEAGMLTKNDAEKFYGIASLEMERRAAFRSGQLNSRPSDPTVLPTQFEPLPGTAREL